jgi:hypothetical protein
LFPCYYCPLIAPGIHFFFFLVHWWANPWLT